VTIFINPAHSAYIDAQSQRVFIIGGSKTAKAELLQEGIFSSSIYLPETF
jgi:hypothetical protein